MRKYYYKEYKYVYSKNVHAPYGRNKQAAQKKFDRTNPKIGYPETLADEIYDDLLAGKLDKVSKVVEK